MMRKASPSPEPVLVVAGIQIAVPVYNQDEAWNMVKKAFKKVDPIFRKQGMWVLPKSLHGRTGKYQQDGSIHLGGTRRAKR